MRRAVSDLTLDKLILQEAARGPEGQAKLNFSAPRDGVGASIMCGREQRVAAGLLAALLSHARQIKMKEIFLGPTESFRAAHRFYEKNGFVEIAQMTLPSTFPAMRVDRKFYRLVLSSA